MQSISLPMPTLFCCSNEGFYIIITAILLDLLLGDPERFPHMVRLIGKAIGSGESLARRLPVNPTVQGAILALSIVAGSGMTVYLMLNVLSNLYKPIYWLVSTFIIYQSLSIRCLWQEVKKTEDTLRHKGLVPARKQIARLVGRDTKQLDEAGISRASIETLSENMVDGVLSPFFYAIIGGPVLAVLFKAISTLDSMIGYKNEKYINFGTVGAKLDDAANFLPARLSIIFIAMAAFLLFRANPLNSLAKTLQERKKHASPNSGIPEAGFAIALDINLAGPAWYHGRLHEKEVMNSKAPAPTVTDIKRAIQLFLVTCLLTILALLGCCFLTQVKQLTPF